jgi:dihydrofolate synthase/folylpolyglutamate synthase
VPGILDELEPAVTRLVVTANSSQRSMDPVKLGELAVSVLGPDRVLVAAGLDEAVETGVRLADEMAAESGRPGSAGLLVTGSVITAGDARRLLLSPAEGDR